MNGEDAHCNLLLNVATEQDYYWTTSSSIQGMPKVQRHNPHEMKCKLSTCQSE